MKARSRSDPGMRRPGADSTSAGDPTVLGAAEPRRGWKMAARRVRRASPLLALALLPSMTPAAAASAAEQRLRAAWVGRHVLLRTPVMSNCDERYTDNRLRGALPASGGRHRFDAGEVARVDMLHLRRARVDLLLTLVEPLRVELREGPFQLYEQLECRVEMEAPAPRDAVRGGDLARLERLLHGLFEPHDDRSAAEASTLWNGRRVEPLPEDHEERLAEYHVWKAERLYLALRDRLAEALDRAADIAARVEAGDAYARGLAAGARAHDPDRLFSAACQELPAAGFSERWAKAPEELDDGDRRQWKEGHEDGQRLRFELALARRLERCLP